MSKENPLPKKSVPVNAETAAQEDTASVNMRSVVCPRCGAEIAPGMAFCQNCVYVLDAITPHEVGMMTPAIAPLPAPAKKTTRKPLLWIGIAVMALLVVVIAVLAAAWGTRIVQSLDMDSLSALLPIGENTIAEAQPTEEPPDGQIGELLTAQVDNIVIPMEPLRSSSVTQVSPVDGMIQVMVPQGEFLMGSADSDSEAAADEKPQRTVHLDTFWIDQTEVTNAMFTEFTTQTDYQTDAEKAGFSMAIGSDWEWARINGANWRTPQGPDGKDALPDHPVVQVSWQDAQAYCEWAGGRLPTEAEWEKAARGENGSLYPWGDKALFEDHLHYAGNSLAEGCYQDLTQDDCTFTAPAGSYPDGASPYGALDMAGNAWEWVADWYSETYYTQAPAENPQGPDSGLLRASRGGSWSSQPGAGRTTNRDAYDPDLATDQDGFRCVRPANP